MKKLLFLSFLGVIASLGGVSVASAAKPSAPRSTTPLGIDVSWPQCGQTLPTDHAFGIVGVNDGLANTTNPCLSDQLSWAQRAIGGTSQEAVQLYVNTANPGGLRTDSWPVSNVDPVGDETNNPYGTCDGEDTLACAWQYGWNRAVEDVHERFAPSATAIGLDARAASYVWWLDVETENTWKTTGTVFAYQSNAAVLEGMTAYFKQQGVRVGLYSTAAQWSQIVGKSVGINSNLNKLPNWRPGGASLKTAKDACKAAPLTAGGTVVLTQFVSRGLDYNYACELSS